MSWNYRVFREEMLEGFEYSIRAAYYAKKGDEAPTHWSSIDSAPGGESIEELRTDLQRMLDALDKPVIDLNQDGHITKPSGQPESTSEP